MRKWRAMACLLVLAATIPAAWRLRGALPADPRGLIEAKYGGWSGVLRLWVCGDWPVAAWLNRCIADFERRHPGVYVQPEYVDAGALSAEGLAPDMAMFGPGAADGAMFAPLSVDAPLLDGLPREERAAPVLMGGTVWVYNAALLDGLPGTWRDTAVAVPEDEPGRLWRAALLGLCSAKYMEESRYEATPGTVDLGLGGIETMPTVTPAGTLDCRLPEDFAPSSDAWQRFVNGEAAAMPVGPREVRRLAALSEQGRGPDWRLAAAGEAGFVDEVAYVGAVAQADAEKAALCGEFIGFLLSDGCQRELHRAGAFAVTGAGAGYGPGEALGEMEGLLRQRAVVAPGPFDAEWRRDVSGIVRDFWKDGRTPGDVWREVAGRLRGKGEHSG